jgi:hypothetical protein
VVLTKAVSQNPALLTAASAINVAGGGVPLVRSGYMASGGIIPQEQIGGTGGADFNALIAAIENIQPVVGVRDIAIGLQRVNILDSARRT